MSTKRLLSEPRSVLVVDDDSGVVAVIKRTLTRQGLAVRTASNGETALAVLRDYPTKLVITDLRMPGMNGAELIARAREFLPTTPFIVITAYPTDPAARQATAAGAAQILTKPFSSGGLVRAVFESINTPHSLTSHVDTQTLLTTACICVCAELAETRTILRLLDNLSPFTNVQLISDSHPIDRDSRPPDVLILTDRTFTRDFLRWLPLVTGPQSTGLVIIKERRTQAPHFDERGLTILDGADLEGRLVPVLCRAIDVAQRKRLIAELEFDRRVAPHAIRLLQAGCQLDFPAHTVAAAARALKFDRSECVKEWSLAMLAADGLTLTNAMNWILLWRIVLLKVPGRPWARALDRLRLPRARLAALAHALANRTPAELLTTDSWRGHSPFATIRDFGKAAGTHIDASEAP